jgi:hypothetical protein
MWEAVERLLERGAGPLTGITDWDLGPAGGQGKAGPHLAVRLNLVFSL